MKLTADEVIARAKAKGVTKSEADIRRVVHDPRKNLKDKNRKQRRRANAPPSPYTMARRVLTAEPDLSTEEVFARLKGMGVTKPDADIREAIHTTRSDLRRKGAARSCCRTGDQRTTAHCLRRSERVRGHHPSQQDRPPVRRGGESAGDRRSDSRQRRYRRVPESPGRVAEILASATEK